MGHPGEGRGAQGSRGKAGVSRPRHDAIRHRPPPGFWRVSKWRPFGETFPTQRAQLKAAGVKVWLVPGRWGDVEVVALFRNGEEAVEPQVVRKRREGTAVLVAPPQSLGK